MIALRFGLAIVCLLLLFLISFSVGRFPVTMSELLHLMWSKITGTPTNLPGAIETVVFKVRGPRVLASMVVGGALAVSGAVYQGLFRNPLVSPDILGVSSGAALGAVLGIYFSLGVVGIQVLAFAVGLGAVAAVYLIGTFLRHHDPILTLVLAGVVIGTLLGSVVGLIKYLADPYNQLPAITFWLLGSLTGVTAADLWAILPAMAAGLVPLYLLRWRINVMTSGRRRGAGLGVDTQRIRLVVIAAATLMTAAAVSVSGIIGWIGLLIPHFARLLVGPDFARLLPAARCFSARLSARCRYVGSNDLDDRGAARRADGVYRDAVLHLGAGSVSSSMAVNGDETQGRKSRIRISRPPGRRGCQLYIGCRRGALPLGSKWRRQDHAVQDDLRAHRPARRRHCSRRRCHQPMVAAKPGTTVWLRAASATGIFSVYCS